MLLPIQDKNTRHILCLKDLANHEDRVAEVNQLGDKLVEDAHPEEETVRRRQQELLEAWERLKSLSLKRQER